MWVFGCTATGRPSPAELLPHSSEPGETGREEIEQTRSYTIKDMPAELRPRERLLKYGAESLSTAELLAILLRVGTPAETVLALSQRLLTPGGLRGLVQSTIEELCALKGVGPAKAAQIKSALELGRRAYESAPQERRVISSPGDAAELLMSQMRYLSRETLRVLCLNTRHQVLKVADVSVGTVSSAVAHPRECFREAIRLNASSVLFVHNHPSGDPAASPADVALTRRLKEAAELLGIELVDHLIIGDGRYESMRDRGLL